MDTKELFHTVLFLSMKGSVLAVIILLIKGIFKDRFNANWHYYIWFLLILRLVIPNAPESSLSVFNLLPTASQSIQTIQTVNEGANTPYNAEVSLKNNNQIGRNPANINTSVESSREGGGFAFDRWSLVWLTGVFLMLLYVGAFNIRFRLMLSKLPRCEEEGFLRRFDEYKKTMNVRGNISIRYTKSIKTPALFGVIRPQLILPDGLLHGLSEEELKYILLHELAHLKRKDNFFNWIVVFVQVLHWFNPMVWYAFWKMREDCEVACDAHVLSRLNTTEHKKYGETIINLINMISKPYWNPVATSLVSNKSSLKKRIKGIAMFKKISWKWSVAAVLLIGSVAFVGLTNQASWLGTPKDERELKVNTIKIRSDIAQIEVIFDPTGPPFWGEGKSLAITDNKIASDIIAMLEDSKPLTDEPTEKDWIAPNGSKQSILNSGNTKNNKLIITGTDGNKKEYVFAYDDLYGLGYIETDGKKVEPKYDFFRYLLDLTECKNPETQVEREVLNLFDKYEWTVDYRINRVNERLPDNLKHKAGEYPTKIYWAYNNELSKQIGLDFSGYLGKDVVIEMYRLRQSLPDFMKPRRNARGIVVKYNGQIIGAYLDSYGFAVSLDRKGLGDITGKNWDGWIGQYIDYDDPLEIQLSQMKPEEIIQEYYGALDKNDTKKVWAYRSREVLTGQLFANCDYNVLFNKEEETDDNIKSAKFLWLSKLEGVENEPGMMEFKVTVYFDYKEIITEDDGIHQKFVLIKKESKKGGWKIYGEGTGP